MAAGAITLVVAGFYVERAVRGYIARRHGPPPVPERVATQQADFTYSSTGPSGQAIYTIRASHFTQFKDQDRAVLQDVWVTIYGKKGDRNDNIHTSECGYQPKAEAIECAGAVEIELQRADGGADASAPGATKSTANGRGSASSLLGEKLQIKTSGLMFNHKSGEASTTAPVEITLPGGTGRGEGFDYSANESVLRVTRGVEFAMDASARLGGLPVSGKAATLEFRRDEGTIALGGPVELRQGGRELTAERATIALDKQYHVQTIAAEGNPVVRGAEGGASFNVAAQKFQGEFDAAGAVSRIVAQGGVSGTRKTSAGEDHFSAAQVAFEMASGSNLLKEMTATGNVSAESRGGANTRTLKTDALRIEFATNAKSAGGGIDKQGIASAETLGPATIESKGAAETIQMKAAKFAAEFGAGNKLERLLGHSGVEITRTPASGPLATSKAAELTATFDARGEWASVDETGNVVLAQDGRQVKAGHAHVEQGTGLITLDGSPVFSDGATRTTATVVTFNQKTGEIRASGGVVSTQLGQPEAGRGKTPSASAISLGEGDAHISADSLSGSSTSGDVTFQGHAKLWQGQAVLNADQIALSQKDGKLVASGSVVAAFPQQAGQGPALPAIGRGKSSNGRPEAILWQVRAQKLGYSNGDGVAHLEGGVTASSQQGSLHSQTLDVYFAPGAAAITASTTARGAPPSLGGRGLSRAVAQGNVTVSQGEIRGRGEQAEYDAAHGRFVLSGGKPTITDGNGNTTTGHSLTFDVASDTISIVSDEGSRTLTRHRVEK